MVIKKVFAAVLLATLTACNSSTSPLASQTAPIFSSSNATVQGSTVEVRIETGTQLKTLAAKKTSADVHHYHIKLINTATGVVMAEGDATDLVSFFQKVPNGTYKVNVDALDATGNSIVQGGAQDSSNTVTVAAPNVTYSDGGPCLKVRLKLLNATGEKVGNNIIVEDGDEWSGTPELQPGGNCPCPSPSPSSPVGLSGAPNWTLVGSAVTVSDGGASLDLNTRDNLAYLPQDTVIAAGTPLTAADHPRISATFPANSSNVFRFGFTHETTLAAVYPTSFYGVVFDGLIGATLYALNLGTTAAAGTAASNQVVMVEVMPDGSMVIKKDGTTVQTFGAGTVTGTIYPAVMFYGNLMPEELNNVTIQTN